MRRTNFMILICLGLLLALALPLAAQEAAETGEELTEQNLIEAARVMRNAGRVQLNFKELDIVKFMRFMTELLEENILVDPEVKGTVTVVSPRAVSLDQARSLMVSVLEMNDLSLQNYGGYSKLVPAKKGPSTDNIVRKGRVGPGSGDQTVVQLVPLDYVSANFVVNAVQTSLGKEISIVPLLSGNGVVLSGVSSLVEKAVGVIRAVDAPESVKVSLAMPITSGSPKTIAQHLTALAKEQQSPLYGIFVAADEASRKIVIVGDSAALTEAERVVKELDVPARAGDFHIYRLENADASVVAEQLGQLLAVAARLEPDKDGNLPNTVVADTATNSLIFAAPPSQYEDILKIITSLDTQPKQVLIRGLIAEVNLTRLNNAGFDWAGYGGAELGSDALFGGQVQLGNTAVPSAMLDYFKDLTTQEELQTRDGQTYKITNTEPKGLLYASISLLNKYDAINVLSMPRLMCTDNMESQLQVGQVIPQLTSRNSDITNPSAVQNSYEYKDTGIVLKVTPHVRSGNLVALDIEQRTEDVLSAQTSDTPVTAKREIKTTFLVRNGDTIVLGGLITESEKFLKNRVPGLSYIPLLGNLFTTTAKQKEKVELILLLTPEILETPEMAGQATQRIMAGEDHDGKTQSERELQERFESLYREAVRNK
ncbi:MAG: type II secretion system secretin GspD [Synergistaceae bacterium]|nr:type II secretion system secretin GspD [Synergistaceae bacterium]